MLDSFFFFTYITIYLRLGCALVD